MPFKFSLYHLLIIVLAGILFSCSDFARIQKSGTTEEKMTKAIEYYNKGDYYKAGVLLDDIAPLMKGKAEAEDAGYYLAYNYYKQDQFVMSAYYFKDFYLTYPRSKRVEEAMYMHINSLYMDSPEYNLDQTSTFECLRAMSNFLTRYPKTQYLDQCNKITQELNDKLTKKAYYNAVAYEKVGNFKSAVVAISNFLKDYPVSEYSEEAYYLRFLSQYKLAKNSIEGKVQINRYYEAIEYYQVYVDKFPGTKHKKASEEMYDSIIESLESIKAIK